MLFNSLEEQQGHWYYFYKTRTLRQIFLKHISSLLSLRQNSQFPKVDSFKCLDIGSGNGIISRSMGSSAFGLQLCWDLVDSAYLPSELGVDKNDPSFSLYDSIPPSASYDIILAIDVVEHVQEDLQFVQLLQRHLAPNGLLVICVPAFQFLWSPHDVFLDHFRRYRIDDIKSLMLRSKIEVVESKYLYVILFPVIVLIRLFSRLIVHNSKTRTSSDLKVYPRLLNTLLIYIHNLERKIFHFLPRLQTLFGLSCVVVGRRIS